MNKLDTQYQALLQDVLDNGVVKQDRTGTGTISLFGRQIRHKMSDGFPLLTTKKVFWKGVVVELLWFLQGRTDLRYLLENDVHIWTGDAYKAYTNHFVGHEDVPSIDWFTHEILHNDAFAAKFGDLGPVYGAQFRKWGSIEHDFYGIDQIANLVHKLQTNPDSRRMLVSAWNVGELENMTLPPCNYSFQVYTRELSIEERLDLASKTYGELFEPFDFQRADHGEIDELYPVPRRAISLMWNQRSCDLFLGAPFNIASYGLLLEILAKATNMVPDELIGNLGDVHLYSNHVEQACEQISREPYALPNLVFGKTDSFFSELGNNLSLITHLDNSDFTLENYQSHPAIKAPLSN